MARGSRRAGRTGDQRGHRTGNLVADAVVLSGCGSGSEPIHPVADSGGSSATIACGRRCESGSGEFASRWAQPAWWTRNRSGPRGNGSGRHAALSTEPIIRSPGGSDDFGRSGCRLVTANSSFGTTARGRDGAEELRAGSVRLRRRDNSDRVCSGDSHSGSGSAGSTELRRTFRRCRSELGDGRRWERVSSASRSAAYSAARIQSRTADVHRPESGCDSLGGRCSTGPVRFGHCASRLRSEAWLDRADSDRQWQCPGASRIRLCTTRRRRASVAGRSWHHAAGSDSGLRRNWP